MIRTIVVWALIVASLVKQSFQEILYENAACYNHDGIMGVCKKLRNCSQGMAGIKSIDPPKICSFMDDHPVVCCVFEKKTRATTTERVFQDVLEQRVGLIGRPRSFDNKMLPASAHDFQNSKDVWTGTEEQNKPSWEQESLNSKAFTTPHSVENRIDETNILEGREKILNSFRTTKPTTPAKTFDDKFEANEIPTQPSKMYYYKKMKMNDFCLNHNGVSGFCKRLVDCASSLAGVKSIIPPTLCGYTEDHPVVCCPPMEKSRMVRRSVDFQNKQRNLRAAVTLPPVNADSVTKKAVYIARKKCKEFAESIIVEIDSPTLGPDKIQKKDIFDICVPFEEPSTGDVMEAKAREYPHMALIGYKETKIQWRCDGNLISERFVLSLAHCSTVDKKDPALWVMLGDMDPSKDYDDAEPQLIRIIKRYVHPDYSSVTLYNNIALFKLERDVTFNSFIRPICLSTDDKIVSQTLIGTGWDYPKTIINEGTLQNLAGTLLKQKLNIVNNTMCNSIYKKNVGSQIPDGIKEESLVCASGQRSNDCQMSRVNSLQAPNSEFYCMYDLSGMTSFGKKCSPDVFTRVSHYLPWIVSIVWPTEQTN